MQTSKITVRSSVDHQAYVEKSQKRGKKNHSSKPVQTNKYLGCFIHLLGIVPRTFCWVATKFISKGTSIYISAKKTYRAVSEVLYRLFVPPEFDLTSDKFKKVVDGFDKLLPKCKSRAYDLNHKFLDGANFIEDLTELNLLIDQIADSSAQLEHYTDSVGVSKNPYKIEIKLRKVNSAYKKLNEELISFLKNDFDKVVNSLEEMKDLIFSNEMRIPAGILTDVNSLVVTSKKIFEFAKTNGIKLKKKKVFLEILDKVKTHNDEITDKQSSVPASKEPFKLGNIGNSCYISSTLQALFCIEENRQKVKKPINLKKLNPKLIPKYELDDPNKLKRNLVAIQGRLTPIINAETPKQMVSADLLNYTLSFMRPSSMHLFRKAVYQSKLTEYQIEDIRRQQDVSSLINFFSNYYLDCSVLVNNYKKTDVFPGLHFIHPNTEPSIQIHLGSGKKQLVNLIADYFSEMQVNDPFKFNSREGIVVDADLTGEVTETETIRSGSYTYWRRLVNKKMPRTLILQLNRFTMTSDGLVRKVNRPISFPKKGVVDLSKYCESADTKVIYKVKSYIIHEGLGSSSGHYVARVEIGDKYYHCNDLDSNFYKPITKKRFLGNRQAYFVILERVDQS